MPEENRQIQFDIQVSLSQAKNSLDDLRKEIKKTRDEIYKASNGASAFGLNDLKAHEAQLQKLKKTFNETFSKPAGFMEYSQQLSNIRKEQELLHQQWITSGKTLDGYKGNMKDLSVRYTEAEKNLKNYNREIGVSGSMLSESMATIKRHALWLATGGLIATLIGVPAVITDIARETEMLGLKMKQNLELADKYHGNSQGLTSDIQHLTEVAGVFAAGYGANVKDVMEMMQILSRRFKSSEEITYYTNLAMVLHKLDFVTPKQAAETLEAVILSMGLNFKESKQFIDEFSVAVHTARITGTDLLAALQRSGASFRNMNMGTAESIAMISTLSTVVAKSGENIGVSLNSLISNIDFKKATQALKAYSIEVYDSTGKMRQGVEVWRDIAKTFNGLLAEGNEEKANEFALAMSGGKFRINDLKAIIGSWGEFEKILNEIQTKASPELTASLLQTGMESFNTKLLQLQASLQVFGITIGNEVLPSLKEMTIGLTTGVQWLGEHRESVSKAIHYLGLLVEMLVSYKVAQILANSKLGEFVKTMWSTVSASSSVKGALGSMGTSFFGLAKSIGAAYVVMKSFQILADAMSSRVSDAQEKKFINDTTVATASDGRNRERSITPQEQEALDAIAARDAYAEQYGTKMGNGSVGFWDFLGYNSDKRDEFDRLNDEARQKIALATSLGKVNAQVTEAEALLSAKPQVPPTEYDKVEGQDIGSKNKSKAEPMAPTDSSFSENKLELKRYTKNLFNILDKNKTDYQEALEELGTFTALFGENNIEAIRQRQQLEQGRILQIQQEQKAIEAQKTQLQSIAGDLIDKYPEMKQVVSGGLSTELPTESGVDIDNVKPAVKSAASALIQEISSKFGVSPLVTSGYREGDPGGHGSGDKLDVAWDNLQWGSDEFNMAVQMAEKAGFSVYAVPHGTGPHLDLNGSSLQGLTELSLNSTGISQDQWKAMSKQERLQYKLNNREESQDNSVLGQTLSQLDELMKKSNEKTKELAKMQADITKTMFSGVFNEDTQRERRLKSVDSDETLSKLNVNKSNPMWSLDDNEAQLSSEMRRYTEYLAEQKKLKQDYKETQALEIAALETAVKEATTKEAVAEATHLLESARKGDTAALQKNTDAQQSNQVKLAQSLEKQKELAESTSKTIKTFWADSFLDMANSGTKFKDIMKNLWSQIQKDAVYALAGIKGNNTSVASSMLGTTGKSGSKANSQGIQGPSMANGSFYKNGKVGNGGKNATGGVVNVPSIAGEDGEETIIPTEKNTANSKKLLDYASNKLGYYPEASGNYAPYFKDSSLATSPMVNVRLQQNQDHIAAIERSNSLLTQQNQMILHMLNNGSGNKQSVVQPIVMSQSMSDDELYNKINRMKSNGYDV